MQLETIFKKTSLRLVAMFAIATLLATPSFAAITLTPSDSLTFNTNAGVQLTKTVTINNTGTLPVVVSYGVTGDNAFTVAGVGTATVAGSGSQTITVAYLPTTSGTNNATLTVSGGGETKTLSLSGTAGTSGGGGNANANIRGTSELHFNNVIAGQTDCAPITLTNGTLNPVTFSNARITADSSEFKLSNTSAVNVLAGGMGTINVCYVPKPGTTSAQGTLAVDYTSALDSSVHGTVTTHLTGTANGSSTGADSLFSITRNLVFSNIPVGTQSCQNVYINNPTSTSIKVDTAMVVGAAGTNAGTSQFSVYGNGGTSIPAHATASYTVCYTPNGISNSGDYNLVIRYSSDSGAHVGGTLITKIDANSEMLDSIGSESTHCIGVRHTGGVLGPIVAGGNVNQDLLLTNNTNQPLTISGVTFSGSDASAFSATTSFPYTIGANSMGAVNFQFAPSASNTNQVRYSTTGTINVQGDATCGPVTVHLGGVATPFHDTSSIDLGTNVGGTVGIKGNGGATLDTINFVNNTGSAITVTGATVTNNANFSVVGTTTPLPTTVQPGGSLGVIVQFNGTTPGVFTTDLNIQTQNAITPQTVQVQAVQAAAGVARYANATINFSVSPNPSRGMVNVQMTGVANATIEVLDILGNTIANSQSASSWVWDGTTAHGAVVSNGAYIIRVTGVTTDGKAFTQSEQVALRR